MAQYVLCDALNAEFAVVVDDAWQRQGLGTRLITMLADQAACAKLAALVGIVLADNWPMLTLLATLGFEFTDDDDPHLIRVAKPLETEALPACAPYSVSPHSEFTHRTVHDVA